ncbi:DHHC palmitoyltransferase-domain-containing protein [Scenedesmus sp. NREL 46B-D3]|nr:DHHC palmitoyltransferase-domain-containing protein [Scenedesmus sp. NREL 46B-D3]
MAIGQASTSLIQHNSSAEQRRADSSMWKYIKYLNVFVFCKFLKLLGNIMVLLVLGIVGFTWYAVVPGYYGPLMLVGPAGRAFGSTVLVVVFSILCIMLSWCYLAAVLVDPGQVPPGWHPFPDDAVAARELELMQYADYYIDRRDPRRPRFCKRCKAWKPERSHHCSVSGHCVLKMDHYCIWVVNCVGLLNYKFFLQFLAYTFVASVMAIACLVKPMLTFFQGTVGSGSAIAFISVVINSAFAASLAGFLVMHANMLAANCTTIEMYEKERIHPWPYNKGWRRNYEEVLGKSKLGWLLPRYTADERRQLLDSCLNTRLLQGYMSSSMGPDAV